MIALAILPPPRTIVTTAEGGGIVKSCECGWFRWFAGPVVAAETSTTHAAKCKGAPEKPAPATPKRAASKWNDREGATWIDKL